MGQIEFQLYAASPEGALTEVISHVSHAGNE